MHTRIGAAESRMLGALAHDDVHACGCGRCFVSHCHLARLFMRAATYGNSRPKYMYKSFYIIVYVYGKLTFFGGVAVSAIISVAAMSNGTVGSTGLVDAVRSSGVPHRSEQGQIVMIVLCALCCAFACICYILMWIIANGSVEWKCSIAQMASFGFCFDCIANGTIRLLLFTI